MDNHDDGFTIALVELAYQTALSDGRRAHQDRLWAHLRHDSSVLRQCHRDKSPLPLSSREKADVVFAKLLDSAICCMASLTKSLSLSLKEHL